jgi:Raf kinase inhibitor-like YbhB/YbcL family protein
MRTLAPLFHRRVSIGLDLALDFALILAFAASAGCKTSSGPQPSAAPGASLASITVTSKSLPGDLQIPVDYSCDGKDLSPQLTWSAPPQGTKALVVMLDDPDASSGSFTHWTLFNLPPETLSLAEGVDPNSLGAKLGQNDFRSVRYNGPCPPRGDLHRYRFWVYAVDDVLPLNEGATRSDLDAALSGHLLGAGALRATFAH